MMILMARITPALFDAVSRGRVAVPGGVVVCQTGAST